MMDSRDIFRRFFGFPNRHPSAANIDDEELPDHHGDGVGDEFPGQGSNRRDDGMFGFFFGDHGKGLDGMFQHFHGDMFRQIEELHRQMEDMMKEFGNSDFPTSFDPPKFSPDPGNNQDKPGQDGQVFIWSTPPTPFFRQDGAKNPRDYMLKPDADLRDEIPEKPAVVAPPSHEDNIKRRPLFSLPYFNRRRPEKKEDTDLDGKISEEKILELIKKPHQDFQSEVNEPIMTQPKVDEPTMGKPRFFSTGRSVSVTTVIGADGKVEQKRVVRDSRGQEENSVTRSLGDKSYTVTTIKEGDGRQERRETFQNMDEKDLPKFEDQWHKPQLPQLPQPNEPADGMLSPNLHPDMDRRDTDLFSKLFGPRNLDPNKDKDVFFSKLFGPRNR